MSQLGLGFLASHTGTNMQSVVRACQDGRLNASPCLVISNNRTSGTLRFAQDQGIPWRHLNRRTHPEPEVLDRAILEALQAQGVEVVLLLGYMKLLGPQTVAAYRGRILNIHPALLPKYGGKGMYGIRVHEAVIKSGDSHTGVTIHLADEIYDHGTIVAQCQVPVMEGDTAAQLAARVLTREHTFLVETLQQIVAGHIQLPGLNRE